MPYSVGDAGHVADHNRRGWTLSLNLPLTSLTDWSSAVGAWSTDAVGIHQTTTSATVKKLYYGPLLDNTDCVAEVEVRINTSTSTTSGRGGIDFDIPTGSDPNGGQLVSLVTKGSLTSVSHVDFEQDASTNLGQVALGSASATGVWRTLRVHRVGSKVAAYVDGTIIGVASIALPAASANRFIDRFALYSYATDVSFRNLKLWVRDLPA
jgi:hypothetical protein